MELIRFSLSIASFLPFAADGTAMAAPVGERLRWQSVLAPAGRQAHVIWELWQFTLWVCIAVFAAVLAAVAIGLWRRRPAISPNTGSVGSCSRRMRWVIAVALLLSSAGIAALFASDVIASRALHQLSDGDALHIEITARQWWWRARYRGPDRHQEREEFTTANELHLPAGRTVVLDLTSDDVIHSLWLPNLNGKLDLIPGRPAQLRLRADKPGLYRGQCAEFCGLEHARMALTVTVQSPEDYDRWAAAQARPAASALAGPARRGMRVFADKGCAQCHTVKGTSAVGTTGPDLTHFASRGTLGAGAFPNTRGHRAGWILNARALKTGVAMPPTELDPDELQALLDYMETLQ